MQRTVYVVMPDGAEWKIQCNGVDYPHYQTQHEATGAAVHAAFAAGKMGFDAHVLIQDSEGRVQVEWAYGDEPRSPAPGWRRRAG
jgi:hypothetical protein